MGGWVEEEKAVEMLEWEGGWLGGWLTCCFLRCFLVKYLRYRLEKGSSAVT